MVKSNGMYYFSPVLIFSMKQNKTFCPRHLSERLEKYLKAIFFNNVIIYTFLFGIFVLVLSSGAVIYSEVRTFMKRQPTMITKYKSITTFWNKTLTLSGKHLIYARRSLNEKFNPMWVLLFVNVGGKWFLHYWYTSIYIVTQNNNLEIYIANIMKWYSF